MTYSIVGVIGHIDHGKTSLVAALTGQQTDTHPEEKKRGITIDLGFASFRHGDHQFAMVDAPGHQKYVGNLLAGVSAIDIGLLVVASDQGIQAQTLEHAAIIQSLGVNNLVIALSRIDLATKERIEQVSEEVEFFLAEYGFQQVCQVRTSVPNQLGINDLREQLMAFARSAPRTASGHFRMPIDRVFKKEGRGSVVAGTPWSGKVGVGDQLQLLPSQETVRVREVEVHGESVEQSEAGFRTALNLVGASNNTLARGDELVSVHHLEPTNRFVVQLKPYSETKPIKCPTTIQLHTATTSCSARLIGPKSLLPGQSATVVVETSRELITDYSQPLLVRQPYPVGSLAGGFFLATLGPKRAQGTRTLPTREAIEFGEKLCDEDPQKRLMAWVDREGAMIPTQIFLQSQIGVELSAQSEFLQNCRDSKFFICQQDLFVSPKQVAVAERMILRYLERLTGQKDSAWIHEDALIKNLTARIKPVVASLGLNNLINCKSAVKLNRLIALASDTNLLSKKQKAAMDRMLNSLKNSRTPPSTKELTVETGLSTEAVQSLLRFASEQGVIVEISPQLHYDADTIESMLLELRTSLSQKSRLSVAEIRDLWQVTRKYAIPLLQYCDQQKYTVRDTDHRTSGPNL